MTEVHLFSNSLYDELFRHNIISCKGYVIANEEKLREYYDFLVQQARDETRDLYKEKNEMWKEAKTLLKEDNPNKKQLLKLQRLFHNLNLEVGDNGLLVSKEPEEPIVRYVGPSEPSLTLWERQIIAKEQREKILKRDLRLLDKWLDEMAKPSRKVMKKDPYSAPERKKMREKQWERTKKKQEMITAGRRHLINKYHQKYDKTYETDSKKEKQVSQHDASKTEAESSYYTASSDFPSEHEYVSDDSMNRKDSNQQGSTFKEISSSVESADKENQKEIAFTEGKNKSVGGKENQKEAPAKEKGSASKPLKNEKAGEQNPKKADSEKTKKGSDVVSNKSTRKVSKTPSVPKTIITETVFKKADSKKTKKDSD